MRRKTTEINAEISKVFGTEMAKLFAAQISEEEMMQTAKDAWLKLKEKHPGYYTSDSDLNILLLNTMKGKVIEKVKELTETEEYQKECEELAKNLITEVRKNVYDRMVEEMTNRLCGYGANGVVADAAYTVERVFETLSGRFEHGGGY